MFASAARKTTSTFGPLARGDVCGDGWRRVVQFDWFGLLSSLSDCRAGFDASSEGDDFENVSSSGSALGSTV